MLMGLRAKCEALLFEKDLKASNEKRSDERRSQRMRTSADGHKFRGSVRAFLLYQEVFIPLRFCQHRGRQQGRNQVETW